MKTLTEEESQLQFWERGIATEEVSDEALSIPDEDIDQVQDDPAIFFAGHQGKYLDPDQGNVGFMFDFLRVLDLMVLWLEQRHYLRTLVKFETALKVTVHFYDIPRQDMRAVIDDIWDTILNEDRLHLSHIPFEIEVHCS